MTRCAVSEIRLQREGSSLWRLALDESPRLTTGISHRAPPSGLLVTCPGPDGRREALEVRGRGRHYVLSQRARAPTLRTGRNELICRRVSLHSRSRHYTPSDSTSLPLSLLHSWCLHYNSGVFTSLLVSPSRPCHYTFNVSHFLYHINRLQSQISGKTELKSTCVCEWERERSI